MVSAKSENNTIKVNVKNTTVETTSSAKSIGSSNPVEAVNSKTQLYEQQALNHANNAKMYAEQSELSASKSEASAEKAEASVDSILKNESFIAVKDNIPIIRTVADDIQVVGYVGENIEYINELVDSLRNLGDTTNIEIVASNIVDVNKAAENIDAVVDVSDNIDAIDIVISNLEDINYVAENIEDIQTVRENKNIVLEKVEEAEGYKNTAVSSASVATSQAAVSIEQATIATHKAESALNSSLNASNSASSSLEYSNIAKEQAQIAIDNADIATAQANNSLSSAKNAKTSETNALTYANNANASATTSTTQAGIAIEQANKAKASSDSSLTSSNNSKIWAEGTDAEVQALGGQHSSKRWSELGAGGKWGDITGTLSNQTDLQNALNDKIPKLVASKFVNNIAGTVESLEMYGRGCANGLLHNVNLGSLGRNVLYRLDAKGGTVSCNYNNLGTALVDEACNTYTTAINPSVDFLTKPFVFEATSTTNLEASDVLRLHIYGHRGNEHLYCKKYKIDVYINNSSGVKEWVTVIDYDGEPFDICQKIYGLFVSGYTTTNYYQIFGIRLTISEATNTYFALADIRLIANRGTERYFESLHFVPNIGGTFYGNVTVKGTVDGKCLKDGNGNTITSTYATKQEVETAVANASSIIIRRWE